MNPHTYSCLLVSMVTVLSPLQQDPSSRRDEGHNGAKTQRTTLPPLTIKPMWCVTRLCICTIEHQGLWHLLTSLWLWLRLESEQVEHMASNRYQINTSSHVAQSSALSSVCIMVYSRFAAVLGPYTPSMRLQYRNKSQIPYLAIKRFIWIDKR